MTDDYRGLYPKYSVTKDGEPVKDCFVLEPESDEAARHALLTYAAVTTNDDLARDLRRWVLDVESGMHQTAVDELSMELESYLDSDDVDYEGVVRDVFEQLPDSEYGPLIREGQRVLEATEDLIHGTEDE